MQAVERRARILALLLTALMTGCATGGVEQSSGGVPRGAARAADCKAGDTRVASEAACLVDDAACYQLASGDWCTGPRGNVCPAGSSALPLEQACPTGSVCFSMSESLVCIAG